jgi:RNA polymerase sigma-70 factor (ECF subfamily)
MLDRSHHGATAEGPTLASQAACQEWYQTYGQAIYSYLRFHLSSPDEAEDLAADVFLRALSRFDQFDHSRGSPKVWLFRIAQNALRDYQRQSKRRPLVSLGSFRDLRCDAPSVEERLLWEEQVGRLLAAMTALSPTDRQIIALCYGAELPVGEAGELLGLNSTAARTRLWRALARLRKLLTP